MASLKTLLFPSEARLFPGQRWLNIALRCLHLVGVAGIGGGFLFSVSEAQWLPFGYLTLGSGVALSLLYLWSDPRWLLQLKGMTIVAKLLLLAAAIGLPGLRAELFLLIVVLSGLIAHAPGSVRGFSL